MQKRLLSAIVLMAIICLGGCASSKKPNPISRLDNKAGTIFPPYSGPKARVAIADFEVKAAKATFEIGSDLRGMLVKAMINNGRFSVVERQALSAVMQGQEVAKTEAIENVTSPESGKNNAADLIISAAVTKFEPQDSGGRVGIGGGGGVGSGILGGLLGAALNKAHMALDIRILDASTSQVLATTRILGQASDVSGSIMAEFWDSFGLGGGLSTYTKTPMEKAIRVCIIEAVRYVSQAIPVKYYKY